MFFIYSSEETSGNLLSTNELPDATSRSSKPSFLPSWHQSFLFPPPPSYAAGRPVASIRDAHALGSNVARFCMLCFLLCSDVRHYCSTRVSTCVAICPSEVVP